MREILFRGKRTGDGEWAEGDLFKSLFGDYKIRETKVYYGDLYLDDYNIIPETVGQYTGLTDKNGKKIFEGDIISAEICEGNYQAFKFPVGVVVFENGAFCIKDFKQTTPLSSYSSRVRFEVIGNIHDNPELLKGE